LDNKSQASNERVIDIEQYLKLSELINDKAILSLLSAEASKKLQSSFIALKEIFKRDVQNNCGLYLEKFFECMQDNSIVENEASHFAI
jgi:hypothetical protein